VAKRAIVTLAIGSAYSERFEQLCRRNWMAYAERHGFDLFVIHEPLDESDRARRRSPAWQKCLILGAPGVADYENVVWIDSDIFLNSAAPSILQGVPIERIGVTDEHRFPTPEMRRTILRDIIAHAPAEGEFDARYWQAWLDPGSWHAAWKLPSGQAHIVQTGVMVLSPKHHREVLEHVYNAYEDRGPNYEMRPLSHEIQSHGLQHWIDPRFNALVWWMFLQASRGAARIATQSEIQHFLLESYRRSYFLHFAGAANLMPLLGLAGGQTVR
jgi:hypothetical protein